MSFSLRISFQRIFIMLLLLALFLPLVDAQNQTNVPAASTAEWFRNHAALIGLIISETMSFLPSKAAGVVKACWSVLQEIFKKKST